jgi:lipoyl(octanoyl) transferase
LEVVRPAPAAWARRPPALKGPLISKKFGIAKAMPCYEAWVFQQPTLFADRSVRATRALPPIIFIFIMLASVISVVQLGVVDYAEGLRLQRRLVELRKAGQTGDVLLLLEHTPVITLGRNAKAANVLASTEGLAARGVEVFECDRGGDVTFHGPGQLVGYPIFDLRGHDSSQPSAVSHQLEPLDSAADSPQPRRKTLGVVDYVRRLEEVLIRTCADFGISTRRVSGLTGVWTGPDGVGLETRRHTTEGKIAAIGVHISRSVTSHGFALNVNTDLSYFNLIVPCGITAKPVTSMQKELGRKLDLNEVAQAVSRNFGSVFGSEMLWVETIDALLGNSVGVPMKAPDELRRLHGEDDLFPA